MTNRHKQGQEAEWHKKHRAVVRSWRERYEKQGRLFNELSLLVQRLEVDTRDEYYGQRICFLRFISEVDWDRMRGLAVRGRHNEQNPETCACHQCMTERREEEQERVARRMAARP